MNKRKTFAVWRAVIAVVAAFAVVWSTGFAFADILRGPTVVTDGAELGSGAYVAADLTYVMDICGVERRGSDGAPVAYFAVAPIGNRFVIVRFPASEYDNFAAMETATMAFLNGEAESIDFHLPVSGTAARADEEALILLEQWFEKNASWMSQAGVIGAVEDYSTYLSLVMIETGKLGGMSYALALALTGLALALLLYAVAEFILIGAGVYDRRPAKKQKAEKPPEPRVAPASEETADAPEAGEDDA